MDEIRIRLEEFQLIYEALDRTINDQVIGNNEALFSLFSVQEEALAVAQAIRDRVSHADPASTAR